LVLITYLALIPAQPVPPSQVVPPAQVVRSEPGKLPLAFVPNQGQVQPEVLFQASDLNAAFFLTATDLVFTQSGNAQNEQAVVRIRHENAQADIIAEGITPLKGQVNYLLGQDPSKWFTHLPTYAAVMFHGLYPGIDLRYDGMHGAFEGIYYIEPGADPALIRWSHSGNVVARLNARTGSIELYDAQDKTGKPVLVEQAPIAYQEIDGEQAIIPSHFTQNPDGSFSYAISAYDPAKTLVIDPTLVYSSYFGGAQLDVADGITLDPSGNIYVTGLTTSTDFPTHHPTQAASKGSDDIFVIKLNPTGSEMIYSTYLGGGSDEEANGLAVDSTGSVYLAGDTTSQNFPLKNAYATDCYHLFDVCVPDAFLTRLSADGSQLLYSTYLGGDDPDMAQGVAVGSPGVAYVVGQTFSSDFPTRLAAQAAIHGAEDAFVTRIDTAAAGTASLIWSTYLGGSGEDMGAAIGLAGAQLVVTGETTSSNFPTHDALQATNKGKQDAFITGMTDGGAIRYSTYLGGADQDTAYGIAVNDQGAYLTGTTLSTDFPTLTPIQAAKQSGNDAFITGINADGSAWMFSTYMGGKGADFGYGVAVNEAGAIYITGSTSSSDFPLLDTLQAYTGNGDAFVAKIDPAGNALVYSTLLGGGDADTGVGIAADNQDNCYIAGITFSADYPVKDPLISKYEGRGDVFVSIITDSGTNPPPIEPPVDDPTVTVPILESINPLFGSFKIGSSSVLAPGETINFVIVVHNSYMEDATADIVDQLPEGLDFKAGTTDPHGTYDAAEHTITWNDVTVHGDGEVELSFDCTTTVTDPTMVTNTATININDETIVRTFDVKLGLHAPVDSNLPVVNKFWIGDQDVLTSRNVTLHIQAQDNESVEKMYIREWHVNPIPEPHWVSVKSSGWVDYAETYDWQLGNQSGVHYLAVVVADNYHNVSIFNRGGVDFASLLLPDTTLPKNGLIPYLVSYDQNTPVKATLVPTQGSPKLFVWYPGNILIPDKTSQSTQVEFTAPRDGTYYFLMYSSTNTTYTLHITPGGGPMIKPMGGNAAPTGGEQDSPLPADPVLSKIGFDPFGSGIGVMPTSYAVYFIPMTRR